MAAWRAAVALFGVPFFRPPRLSPGLDPLGILLLHWYISREGNYSRLQAGPRCAKVGLKLAFNEQSSTRPSALARSQACRLIEVNAVNHLL